MGKVWLSGASAGYQASTNYKDETGPTLAQLSMAPYTSPKHTRLQATLGGLTEGQLHSDKPTPLKTSLQPTTLAVSVVLHRKPRVIMHAALSLSLHTRTCAHTPAVSRHRHRHTIPAVPRHTHSHIQPLLSLETHTHQLSLDTHTHTYNPSLDTYTLTHTHTQPLLSLDTHTLTHRVIISDQFYLPGGFHSSLFSLSDPAARSREIFLIPNLAAFQISPKLLIQVYKAL